jgi:predicted esterase
MKNYFFIIALLFCSAFTSAQSQVPYQTAQYAIRKDSAVLVGTVPNYCGNAFDIKINIYKPIGDNNKYRPLGIFAHGGGFTSNEDFNEYQMSIVAQEFAKRGYVAVTMDYREGHHLYPYGPGSPYPIGLGIFLSWIGNTFVYDSAEVIRSAYRAQQDMKAVIRFMKKRQLQDSTDACKTFIGGHSAGAITTLTAATIDNASEKPILTSSLANAPNPLWQNTFLQINGPLGKDDAAYRQHNPGTFNFDAAACYTRPDLGDVNGTIQIDATVNNDVLGIMSLAGGIADTNNISIPGNPAMFLYHIPLDLVVPFQSGRPFQYLSSLLAPAPNGNWPIFYGSNWLNNKLNITGYPTAKKFWVYDNGGNPLNSHDILPSPATVTDTVAKFFAAFMDTCQKCNIQDTAVNFTAEKLNNTSLLKWGTILYSKIAYVVVERSANNIAFDSIGKVTAQNNVFNYQFVDANPILKGSYYQLKIFYKNGTVKYSVTRFLQFILTDKLVLYPNPVSGSATLLLPSSIFNKNCSLVIVDAVGKKVMEKKFAPINASEIINCSRLQKGVYFLFLTGDGIKEKIPFTRL